MATGDATDFLGRLKSVLPAGWFPTESAVTRGLSPVLDAVLSGPASSLAFAYALTAYAKSETRLATATDVWLDLFALDYFGPNGLPRRQNESDASYAARIRAALFAPKATRAAVISALQTLTGHAPRIFEPANTGDTGAYTGASVATNLWPNSSLAGVVAGTPGTVWTGGEIDAGDPGISVSISDFELSDGIPCVSLSITGTPTATGTVNIWPNGRTPIAITQLTNTVSFYGGVTGGALPGAPYIQDNFSFADKSGSAYTSDSLEIGYGPVTASTRFAFSWTFSAGTVEIIPLIRIPFTAGVPVAVEFQVGGFQAEPGGVATPFVSTDGAAFSVATAPFCGLAYNTVGGYGSLELPFQAFITAYRPLTGGVANVGGYYAGSGWAGGGYGVGAIEYVSLADSGAQVTDADIYAAIAATMPAGTIGWTAISGGTTENGFIFGTSAFGVGAF